MTAEVPSVDPAGDVGRLKGWVPVDAVVKHGRPGVVWLDMTDLRFGEPLFCQTVARVRRERPERRECFTGLETLIQFEQTFPGLVPTGFIFHSSRCGSTLVANACRALDGALVISEACAIDKLVGRFFTGTNDDATKELWHAVLLRAAVNALGQPRAGGERRYFVKFSCVSVLQLPRIRRIWPAVPLVFVYRDPLEVAVSNLENLPAWLGVDAMHALAAAVLGAPGAATTGMSRGEFCARAVGRFYAAAHDWCDDTASLVNYSELSLDALLAIVEHFGVRPTAVEAEAIGRALRVSAKDPGLRRPFVRDSEAKQAAATPEARRMVADWARAPYLRLEAKRKRRTVTGGGPDR